MSKKGVTVSEKDLAKIGAALDKLDDQLSHDFFRQVGRKLVAMFQLGFKAGKAPDGTPWAPVARGGQPLRLTGRLNRSIGFKATPDNLAIGTNVAYAKTHQHGLNGPVSVPKHTRKQTHAWGKPIAGGPITVEVKGHTKIMKINPRPFLGIEAPQRRAIATQWLAFMKGKIPQGDV